MDAVQPQPIDLIVEAAWVIPVEPAGAVLERHALAVRDGRIVAVMPAGEARRRYAARSVRVLDRHVLVPGLVNLHTHASMTLLRGVADDVALMTWLREHIWPAESRLVSDAFVHDGTLLASLEMLRAGVTCFNDMYFFQAAAARAAGAAGIRAVLGVTLLEVPTQWAGTPDEYLDRGLAVREELAGAPRLSWTLAPHAPYTVSDAGFARVAELAESLELPVHVHVQETAEEVAASVREHGRRPLARLDALGLVNDRLLAVHAVHVTEEEIALLAERGSHVAHCPAANLKLASGIAPVAALLAAGANVGIGTDGAASNNRLDVLGEARLAALLAKAAAGDAAAVPAHEALRMMTLRSARALGLDARIGSLVPGKAADFVAVELAGLEVEPCYDPASHLVYAAGREHVSHVWVDGRAVVEDRLLRTDADVDALRARVAEWQGRVRGSG